MADSSENRLRGEAIVRQMHLDILSNHFDTTLNKYKPHTHLTVIESAKPRQKLDLLSLWEKYTEFRSNQVEATTLAKNYATIANHLKKLPSVNLEDAVVIRDFLISNSSAYTTKQILTQINACCNLSLRAKLIKSNPFNNMAGEIQLAKNSTESLDIDPFSKEERDVIIETFRTHPKYKCYAPFVELLFLTGCRTSKAIGLKWKHINFDCSKITFCEAVVNTPGGKVRKGLKKQDKRIFPCNNQLQSPGRSGALLPLSPLRTERASFQALGSSKS